MINPLEHDEHKAFVRWFRLQYSSVLIFAIPNGGDRHPKVAQKLKAEGVVKGVPDLFVPEWRLWVEMKRRKGSYLSTEQKVVKAQLEQAGYAYIVGKGAEDAAEQVKEFRLNNVCKKC